MCNSVQRVRFGQCSLCNRETHLTYHHLIPRKMHRRTHFKKRFDRATLNLGINICRRCHTGLHKLFDEMTLARDLNTLQALRENEAVQKHCAWVRRQKV